MTGPESTLAESVEALRTELLQLRRELQAVTGGLPGPSGNGGNSPGHTFREQARERLEQFRQYWNTAREKGGKAVESTQRQIAAYPLTSVAIALGAGLLIGRALSRR